MHYVILRRTTNKDKIFSHFTIDRIGEMPWPRALWTDADEGGSHEPTKRRSWEPAAERVSVSEIILDPSSPHRMKHGQTERRTGGTNAMHET